MRLTEQGRDLRRLPTDDSAADADPLLLMPTLATRAEPLESHPAGETWAVGESDTSKFPVVSSRPFGVAGRVVVVEGSGMCAGLVAPEICLHESIYGRSGKVSFAGWFRIQVCSLRRNGNSAAIVFAFKLGTGGGHAANSRGEFLPGSCLAWSCASAAKIRL